jgi:hypothetical protein
MPNPLRLPLLHHYSELQTPSAHFYDVRCVCVCLVSWAPSRGLALCAMAKSANRPQASGATELVGRISWLRRVRLETPLGRGNFLPGLKLSGERGGGLGLARFTAVCPLGGYLYVRKWPFMARRYGRCCMYGPDYVKLSRVFAVQLFSIFIGHYVVLTPVRSDPYWPHSQPCHHRLHSPRLHPYTATRAARDPNLDSGNHDMSRLSTLAYPNDAPIHGLTDVRLAYSQRVLGVAPPPPSLSTRHGNTHCSRPKPRQW